MFATSVVMCATGILHVDLRQAILVELRHSFGQRLCGRAINRNTRPLETIYRTGADAADNHCVHLPASQCPQRITGPVDVILIAVGQRLHGHCFRVNQHK